jgi:large subunit ribosomal protein L29
MKAAEIRELETEELHGRIAELKEELFNLRFQLATGQLDNHRRMRAVRQDIARIRTVLRERDFATVSAGAPSIATSPLPAEPDTELADELEAEGTASEEEQP